MPTYSITEELKPLQQVKQLDENILINKEKNEVSFMNNKADTPIQNTELPIDTAIQQQESANPPSDTGITIPLKEKPRIPLWTRWSTVFNFIMFLYIIWVRETCRLIFTSSKKRVRLGYSPLIKDFDEIWNRLFYRRICDCFNRPIDSRPSRVIGVMERVLENQNTRFVSTGKIIPAINLGSYNYLGFADDIPSITCEVVNCLGKQGIASCSAPLELGQNAQVTELEKAIAAFLGKDDAVVCGMGFGTNFTGLPALFGKGTLVLSDHLNHSSIINGVRASGAKVKVFQHNDFKELDELVRQSIILGQNPAGAYQTWERIVIIVEGIYSMEGEIIDLPTIISIKKKYKTLLFVDEAHSIGAIGRTGRGVCEHYGVDTKDVDVLMGTFTKSFGSIGGYIAGNQRIVDYIRLHSKLSMRCDTLAPVCAQQVLSVLNVILGKDGTDIGKRRITALKENSYFLRQGLIKLGFAVLGDDASPVIPLMTFNLPKLSVLSRYCLQRGLAIVVVGYPATPLLECRIRFCVSAAHTREDLQYVLNIMQEVSERVYLTYQKKWQFQYNS